ncbi:MAG: NAD(P)/FAD-dependent oxidoreductase [Novosphingobium sp.]|nr:NAD(P)/FAD-dependent oxidoreductase [Novosphingobium sp.]
MKSTGTNEVGTHCDCLVIGGGPAGLTAAIYLARFHLSVTVIDAGHSRAASIPMSRNVPGFPEGITGTALLDRMRRQARTYGANLRRGTVTELAREGDGFLATTAQSAIRARTVLLATGVINRRPPMLSEADHDRGLTSGLIRYCPICDGYEVTGQRIAVLGTGERGRGEALFLRSYSTDVTLVAPAGGHTLSEGDVARLTEAGVVIAGACRTIRIGPDKVEMNIEGAVQAFDTMYPALGSDICSQLAGQLGASLSDEGCLLVDSHQRTGVPGLYAAGDVVLGLDQITHATGEAGVAATTIRNDLAAATPAVVRRPDSRRGLP